MYSIFSTSQFKKDLKKAQKSGLDIKELKSVINCLARGEELDVTAHLICPRSAF